MKNFRQKKFAPKKFSFPKFKPWQILFCLVVSFVAIIVFFYIFSPFPNLPQNTPKPSKPLVTFMDPPSEIPHEDHLEQTAETLIGEDQPLSDLARIFQQGPTSKAKPIINLIILNADKMNLKDWKDFSRYLNKRPVTFAVPSDALENKVLMKNIIRHKGTILLLVTHKKWETIYSSLKKNSAIVALLLQKISISHLPKKLLNHLKTQKKRIIEITPKPNSRKIKKNDLNSHLTCMLSGLQTKLPLIITDQQLLVAFPFQTKILKKMRSWINLIHQKETAHFVDISRIFEQSHMIKIDSNLIQRAPFGCR